MGLLTALLIDLVYCRSLKFDEGIFFNFILPPIIFAAGYNLRKKDFFENFGYIMFFGLFGTICTFALVSSGIFLILRIIPINLHPQEILLFSCILSATDTVAALSLVKESRYPKLNSILFGEGIMNDAVSILIFRTVKNYFLKEEVEFGFGMVFLISLDFLYLLFMSVMAGVGFGLVITFLLKTCYSFKKYPVKETSLMILTAYLSYQTSEILKLSGIISLFVCGIVMAHYTFHNLSDESQKGTVLAFDTVGYLAEALVFAYLGLTVFWIDTKEFNVGFIIAVTIVLFAARLVSVFLLPLIFRIMRRPFTLNSKELKIIWYSGLIRGAIAFALSFHIDTPNKNLIVATTISIVLITTFILSTLLQSFAVYIGLAADRESELMFEQVQKFVIDPMQTTEISGYRQIGGGEQLESNEKEKRKNEDNEKMGFFQKKWVNFDEKVMKPFFIKRTAKDAENMMGLLEKKGGFTEMIDTKTKG